MFHLQDGGFVVEPMGLEPTPSAVQSLSVLKFVINKPFFIFVRPSNPERKLSDKLCLDKVPVGLFNAPEIGS